MTSFELLQQGLSHHQAGRFDEAEQRYRQAIAADPQLADAWHLLGALALQRGQTAHAAEQIQKAIALRPDKVEYHTNLAAAFLSLEKFAAAAASLRQALQLEPNSATSHYQLGSALQQLGQWPEARQAYERAIALQPDFADAHNNLGNWFVSQNLIAEAATAFQRAMECNAKKLPPRYNLAGLLQNHGHNERAIELYEQVLQLDPRHVDTLRNLGAALQVVGRFDDARACYRRALEIEPNFVDVWSNLGTLEQKQGDIASALECYRRALEIDPNSSDAGSNLLVCQAHDPDVSPEQLFEAHRSWGLRHTPLVTQPPYANVRVVDRPLRVGYVSADFVRHPVMRFFISIVENHNPAVVQAYHYSQVRSPDRNTAALQRMSQGWRSIVHLSDEQAYDLIRADQIDILVDLSGHTSGSRLQLFARRPAPIAVTYLGYPTTTGVPAIDYRLTDAVIDAPGGRALSTETLWYLPGCFTALAPLVNVPEVSDPPVARTGVFTFGSFHKVLKLNRDVIGTWCRILHALPSTRLLLLRDTLVGEVRERLMQRFADHGISPARLDVRNTTGPGGHLSVYSEVDISLDTFPWSGHTTACESLWMGVPMLTMLSDHHAGRMVSSVLTALDLRDWIATTPDEYLAKAKQLSSDLSQLAALRSTLRQRLRTSPLCDGRTFTRNLEQAYREMWRRYLVAT